jgi:hypothetical protein
MMIITKHGKFSQVKGIVQLCHVSVLSTFLSENYFCKNTALNNLLDISISSIYIKIETATSKFNSSELYSCDNVFVEKCQRFGLFMNVYEHSARQK